jgi:hypothetical protein
MFLMPRPCDSFAGFAMPPSLAAEVDAMKTSSIRFGQLRHLLLDLHFLESRMDAAWRFEHPQSDTIFLFRPYALAELVTVQDLHSTRKHLDWRGLLPAHAFDDFLTKTPA